MFFFYSSFETTKSKTKTTTATTIATNAAAVVTLGYVVFYFLVALFTYYSLYIIRLV